MNNRGRKLIVNSLILLIGSILTKGINFMMAPLFTRWLSVADYGLFDLLSTYSMLLIPIVAFGVHHAVFRFLIDAKTIEEKNKVVINSVFVNGIGFIIYALIILIIVKFRKDKEFFLMMLTVLLVAQSLQNYVGMYLRGLKNINLYTKINVLCTFGIMLFVTIFVKFLNYGLIGMVIGYSMAYFISAIIGLLTEKSQLSFRINEISYRYQKKMLSYSLPMVPNSIAWWILNISDRIIVSSFLGVEYNGILAVANKIPNLCITFFDVFQTAWVENVSEAINDNDWEYYFTNIFNLVARLILFIAIFIVTTNFFVFKLLFTHEYFLGIKLVPILSIAVVFSALGQFLGSVFVAEYNSKKQGITITQAGIVNLVAHLLLIKFIGIYAAVVSTLLAYVTLYLIRFCDLRRKYCVHIKRKTFVEFIILLLSVLLSYVNNNIISFSIFIVSFICVMVLNRDIIQLLFIKIAKRFS